MTRTDGAPPSAPRQAREPGWSSEVVDGTVHGHPCRRYASHPVRVDAVLLQAQRWPDRVFLVQGDRRMTFAEHEQAVVTTARALRAAGVGRGDRVAVYAGNSPDWVALFFAVLAVEAIFVPCNGWWSAEELAQGIAAVSPTVVVCDAQHFDRVPSGLRVLPLEALVRGTSTRDDAFEQPSESDASTDPWIDVSLDSLLAGGSRDEDEPAVILFTAGTTGFPKGAVLSHRALLSNLQTLLAVSRKLPHLLPDEPQPSVTLVALPLFHVGAIQLILVPMMTGSRVAFLEGRFDAGAIFELVERERVTMFSGVPTMMERMLNHPAVRSADTSSVRTIVLGGSPVSNELLARVREGFPAAVRRVGQTYGLTEAGGVVSTGVGEELARHSGSSGRIPAAVEIRVISAVDGTDIAPAALPTADDPEPRPVGEIMVRSASCMDGYWMSPGDRTVDADGWLRTGDTGWVSDDGFLYVTGRNKDLIIRGGENVGSARVEAVLTEHPEVLEAAVVGLPDADLGERVAALIVHRPGARLTAEELRAYASGRLGRFEVPDVWLLRTEPLPVNDSGKVLKVQLAEQWSTLNHSPSR